MVQLINRGTRLLDRAYAKHPRLVLIVMALVALAVAIIANSNLVRVGS